MCVGMHIRCMCISSAQSYAHTNLILPNHTSNTSTMSDSKILQWLGWSSYDKFNENGTNGLSNESVTSVCMSIKEIRSKLFTFIDRNFFLVFVIVAIMIAAAYPYMGREGGPIRPEYTVSYGATMLVFVISGLTLKTAQLKNAFLDIPFNVFVQTYSLVCIPLAVWILTLLLRDTTIHPALLDGLRICGALPTTVSMCVVLTSSAGGDDCAALFNATFGNFLGIFITPLWLVTLVRIHASVSFTSVFLKLLIKVIIPVTCGQVALQLMSNDMRARVAAHGKHLKRTQDCLLVAIAFTTFSTAFSAGFSVTWGDLFSVTGIVLALQVLFSGIVWRAMSVPCLKLSPRRRVAGLFASTQKTIALGIPLITAVFEGSDNLSYYTIPILIYHPMQLVLGSLLIPHLSDYIKRCDSEVVEQSLPEESGIDEGLEVLPVSESADSY